MGATYYHLNKVKGKNTAFPYEEVIGSLRAARQVETEESSRLRTTFILTETGAYVRIYNLAQRPSLAAAPIEVRADQRSLPFTESALRTIIGEIQEHVQSEEA